MSHLVLTVASAIPNTSRMDLCSAKLTGRQTNFAAEPQTSYLSPGSPWVYMPLSIYQARTAEGLWNFRCLDGGQN